MSTRRLYRSNDGLFLGVLAGLAEYFRWDKSVLRLLFVIVLFFTGLFPLLFGYLVWAMIVPREGKNFPPSGYSKERHGPVAKEELERMQQDIDELKRKAATKDVESDWEQRFHQKK